ncbi:MAG: alanine--tRNA ligase [Sedimentisphaerales bacterium]|nr:alanine--tRNA ligase [Sedimentisphaerales bacterium]
MMLSAKQIRAGFIDFFKGKDHAFVPSSPIVPIGDQTLLFANAGMNQFKDIFLGLATPSRRRAVNSQKCLRVSGKHNDLEEVGHDNYHHTFFEMLGNWSFGDYFKAETIEWAWQLLTEVWGINPDQLCATVFAGDAADNLPEDSESASFWTKFTPLPAGRVLKFGKKDNFWEMGETGPCGPCSEIHIDLGPERCDKKDVPGHKCAVNAGCARFIELWNLVFIQFNRAADGKLTPLPAKYVDTGAGLERIAAVMQNKRSNYDTDLFSPITEKLTAMTGQKFTSQLNNKTDNAFRVIADHIRALTFAITDGATPSNEGRGYVIRRILRRASRFGREIGLQEPFLYKLVPAVDDCLGEAFPEIKARADYISTVIESEEASFGKTLDRGLEIFNAAADKAQKSKSKTITGDDAFQLYDTYGFPIDLTQLMAQERGLSVNTAGFDTLMEQQRSRARAAQKGAQFLITIAGIELPVTEDLHKYKTDRVAATISGFIDQGAYKTDAKFEAGAEIGVVLDKTCFYAEMGGQVGDCGTIEADRGKFFVDSTAKVADCVIHRGHLVEGTLAVGDKVTATVSHDRDATKKNHTATHLLQWALQQVLGKSVAQQGSLVCPDYLRFDFTYPKAMTPDEVKKVEELVRGTIIADLPVACAVLPRNEAEKVGAMALFGEKYGEEVRVVAVGAQDEKGLNLAFSKEFCGGTHVDRTGVITDFKIIKEESVSAGVRRITALTGQGLSKYLEQRSDIIDELAVMLKVSPESIIERVSKILAENKKFAKQLKSAPHQGAADSLAEAKHLLESCIKTGDVSIIVGKLSPTTVEQARAAIDMLKMKAKPAVIVLGFVEGDKATLLAGVTDDLVKTISASDILKQISPIIEGGGGGRPNMAQAGGKKPEKLDDALSQAADVVKAKLKSS